MKHLLFTLAAALLLVPVCGCSRAVDPDSGSNVTEISSISEKTSSGDVPPVEQDERKKESSERLIEPDKSSGISGASSAPPNSQNYEPSVPSVQSPPPQNQTSVYSTVPDSSQPVLSSQSQASSSSQASEEKSVKVYSASSETSKVTQGETYITPAIEDIVFDKTAKSEWPNEQRVQLKLKDTQEIDALYREYMELLHFDTSEEYEEMGINTNTNVIEMDENFDKKEKEWQEKKEPRRQEILIEMEQLRREHTDYVLSTTLKTFYPVNTAKNEKFIPSSSSNTAVMWLMLTPEEIKALYQSGDFSFMEADVDFEDNPIS